MKTIIVDNRKYEVAEADYPEKLTWREANKIDINGWNLPHTSELRIMFNNREDLNGFDYSETYLSSTQFWDIVNEHNVEDGSVYVLNFKTGEELLKHEDNYACKIRLIREIK